MKLRSHMKKTGIPTRDELEDWLNFCKRNKLNVIPCGFQAKTPAIGSWLPYQSKMSTEAERKKWFLSGDVRNIAVVTGTVSDYLVVIDFDDPKWVKKIFKSIEGEADKTLIVETSKGRYHVYYKLKYKPPNIKIAHFGIDVKGEGGYVLFPPSVHPSGRKYKAISNLSSVKIKRFNGDIVEWLLDKCSKADKKFDADAVRQAVSIDDLLKPKDEGERDNSAVMIATWYRMKGLTEEEALDKMQLWNKENKPPLNNDQLFKCVHSAYKRAKPYKFKFVENPLETEEFDKATKEDGEKLMKQPEIIPYILEATPEVKGEENTKVTVFLLNLVGESVDLSGDSSSGKNTVVDIILDCYPIDTVLKITGASAKVLRFLKEVHTLYFAERGAYKGKGDEETVTEYDIKVAISEGALRTFMTTKKEGEWGYQEIVTKIGNIITTSTSVDITPELKNRIWELTTDAGKKLTQKIVVEDYAETAGFTEERPSGAKQRKVLRYVTKQILKEAPKKYVIPYAPLLVDLFVMKPRARRDKDKLKKAIYASAILHLKSRMIMRGHIICTPADFLNAWTYMNEAIVGTFSGETKRFMEMWSIAQEMMEKGKVVDGTTLSLTADITRDRALKWIKRFVRQHLGVTKNYPKSKKYYFIPMQSAEGDRVKVVKIKMSDLYDRYFQWCNKYDVPIINRSVVEFEKKNKNEKIIFFRKRSTDQLIADLPDMPKQEEDSSIISFSGVVEEPKKNKKKEKWL